jgi:hypothetical protein
MRQLFLCGCACVLVALVAVLVNVFSQSMRGTGIPRAHGSPSLVVLAATNVKKKDVLILCTYTRNIREVGDSGDRTCLYVPLWPCD